MSTSNVRYNRAARVHKLHPENSTAPVIITALHTVYDIAWEASLSQHPAGNPVWSINHPGLFYGSSECDVHVTSHLRLFLDLSGFDTTDTFKFVVVRTQGAQVRTVLPNTGQPDQTISVVGGEVLELLIGDFFMLPSSTNFKYGFKLIEAKNAQGGDLELEGEAQVKIIETSPISAVEHCYATVGMFELVDLTQAEAIPLSASPE